MNKGARMSIKFLLVISLLTLFLVLAENSSNGVLTTLPDSDATLDLPDYNDTSNSTLTLPVEEMIEGNITEEDIFDEEITGELPVEEEQLEENETIIETPEDIPIENETNPWPENSNETIEFIEEELPEENETDEIIEDFENSTELINEEIEELLNETSIELNLTATELIVQNELTTQSTINFTYAEGLIVYGEGNVDTITYNMYNGTNFTGQLTGPDVGGDTSWVKVVGNHEYDQMVVGIEENIGNDVHVFIAHPNQSFTNQLEVSTDIPNAGYRAFDLAVEDLSGDVLIVYENTSTADLFVQYQIWNGTDYSGLQNITHGMASSAVGWVELVSQTKTDNIMLLIHDTEADGFGDVYAVPWDGNSFDTSKGLRLSEETTSTTEQHFAFAWEEASGQGIIVYGEGTNLVWRTYDPTSGFGSVENNIGLGADNLDAVRMCSDPTADYIGLIWQDSGTNVNVSMWDGTQMLTSPPTHDALTEGSGLNNINVDCAWYDANSALFSFDDVSTGTKGLLSIDYFNFTKSNTWSISDLTDAPTTATFASDDIDSLRFAKHPSSEEIMVVTMDIKEDVALIKWNGTAFAIVEESPIEDTTEAANGAQEGVMFDYSRYDLKPNVTTLQPADDLNHEIDATIMINVTVTDNIKVETVLANITLPNSSIVQLTLVNSSGNSTHYNKSFTVTDLDGKYTLRIIANDTSTHQNINSSQTVTFTIGDAIPPNVTNTTLTSFDQSAIVNISANITDTSNISIVSANITVPNGSIFQVTLANQSALNSSGMIVFNQTFPHTSQVGLYGVLFIANDTYNNINNTQTTNFNVGDGTYPNVTNLSPSIGSSFDLNAFINISANVTDNINVSTVTANITVSNNSIFQITLINRSWATYNGTFSHTSSSGIYTLRIIANDSANNINSSETTTFTIGDTIAPTISHNAPTNRTNTSSTSVTFNFTATESSGSNMNCSVFINGTANATNISVVSGAETLFIINNFVSRDYSWNISCNDSVGNNNQSGPWLFTVDTINPQFNSLTTSPSSEADLDPNVNVTVFANVTDNHTTIDTVIFQYKLSSESTFTNVTMTYNSGDLLYNTSFNASTAGTYNLQVWANDTVNNKDYSSQTNITIQLDKNWTRSPVTFSAVRTDLNNNITLGNLTINNSGDYPLEFNISSDSSYTAYNQSTNFNLTAGELMHLQVYDNATSSGVKTVTINITVNDSDAVPTDLKTTGQIVVAPNQPVLSATFTTPSGGATSVTQGDSLELIAQLENIGEGNASNVSFFMTLPSSWTLTFGSTNLDYDELNSGDIEENTVRATIPSDFAAGNYNVFVNATGINGSGENLSGLGYVFGDTLTVTINAISGTVSGGGVGETATSGSAAAGTTTAAGGGGIGSVSRVTETSAISFTEEIVRIAHGKSQIIPVSVTNTWENATLQDVTLEVEGFLAQYVSVSPESIRSIRTLQSKEFNLNLDVPTYFTESEYILKTTITGNIVAVNPEAAGFTTRKMTEYRTFILKVEEVGEEELFEKFILSEELIQEMAEAGFNIAKAENLLQEAQAATDAKEFIKAKDLLQQVEQLKKDAFVSDQFIKQVQENMAKAESKWLDTPKTEDALKLALLAFERGDFTIALDRVKNAQLIFVLETKGRVNILKFIIDWWWALLLGFLAAIISGFFVYKYTLILIIDRRLKNINKEEETLQGLLEENQKKYLVEMTLSEPQFRKYVQQYEKRLTRIRQIRVKLRNQRVAILKTEQELKNTKKEKEEIQQFLKLNQTDYFLKGKLSRRKFMDLTKQNEIRLTEIEHEEEILQERLEKEKGTKKYNYLIFVNKITTLIESKIARFKEKRMRKEADKEKELKKEKLEKGRRKNDAKVKKPVKGGKKEKERKIEKKRKLIEEKHKTKLEKKKDGKRAKQKKLKAKIKTKEKLKGKKIQEKTENKKDKREEIEIKEKKTEGEKGIIQEKTSPMKDEVIKPVAKSVIKQRVQTKETKSRPFVLEPIKETDKTEEKIAQTLALMFSREPLATNIPKAEGKVEEKIEEIKEEKSEEKIKERIVEKTTIIKDGREKEDERTAAALKLLFEGIPETKEGIKKEELKEETEEEALPELETKSRIKSIKLRFTYPGQFRPKAMLHAFWTRQKHKEPKKGLEKELEKESEKSKEAVKSPFADKWVVVRPPSSENIIPVKKNLSSKPITKIKLSQLPSGISSRRESQTIETSQARNETNKTETNKTETNKTRRITNQPKGEKEIKPMSESELKRWFPGAFK